VNLRIDAVEEALAKHGRPEIFNTGQGSQFTSAAFTGLLLENKIAISMDGRGAWRDNVFVSIREHIEHLKLLTNSSLWMDLARALACGRTRTEVATTAASCVPGTPVHGRCTNRLRSQRAGPLRRREVRVTVPNAPCDQL